VEKIASIAVLLQYEGAGNAGSKPGKLNILQPDMSVGNKVRVM
jgi:hypothetical protein